MYKKEAELNCADVDIHKYRQAHHTCLLHYIRNKLTTLFLTVFDKLSFLFQFFDILSSLFIHFLVLEKTLTNQY
jgi:hypothetical protein